MRIDGRAIASRILDELKKRVQKLKEKGINPCLQIILVGENPQSQSYIQQKKLKGEEAGIKVNILNLESTIENSKLLNIIKKLNEDNSIHGIVIQRPLPPQINSGQIDEAVIPEKDVDGFNKNSKFYPPLGEAIIILLENADKNFKTKKITIIGKGPTGGGAVMNTFKRLNIPFQIIDSKTDNPLNVTTNSDI